MQWSKIFDAGFMYILILSTVEIVGDFALRFYAKTGFFRYLTIGIIGYIGVVYYLVMALRFNNVLYVNGLWDGISGLIESIAAYYILGDRLEKTAQYIGLLFVIAGITLMKME